MSVPLPDRMEDSVYGETPTNDFHSNNISHSPSSADLVKRRCSCNCSCDDNNSDEDESDGSATRSPSRGRSRTPKYDRTNGNGRSVAHPPTQATKHMSQHQFVDPVHGQDALAAPQLKPPAPVILNGPHGDNAILSVQRWLSQYHDEAANPFCFSGSPQASMLVEASTACPSLASSGFLLSPRASSSGGLMAFATGGFDEDTAPMLKKTQVCDLTPLWLTRERRCCRDMHSEIAGQVRPRYPATLELDGR